MGRQGRLDLSKQRAGLTPQLQLHRLQINGLRLQFRGLQLSGLQINGLRLQAAGHWAHF
jgi:hypothetical protein